MPRRRPRLVRSSSIATSHQRSECRASREGWTDQWLPVVAGVVGAVVGPWSTAAAVGDVVAWEGGHDARVLDERSPALLTVGYEGRSVDDVVAGLVAQEVSLLIDVRLTPLSRKRGLSKRGLTEHLAAAGIEYLHLRALGNPVDNRDGLPVASIKVVCDQPADGQGLV
ncbi:DUF488 domain-containing protein [Pseudonocardia sp. S2-4]|uniref:DUF488 domain-containing protein n=1 Tax=Pseudonocardia humida TaxID=2800819 RepID=A0ABT1ABW1_9PSEU|nr:DUF488 domain-containing protein [Pseudonocardia humida]